MFKLNETIVLKQEISPNLITLQIASGTEREAPRSETGAASSMNGMSAFSNR